MLKRDAGPVQYSSTNNMLTEELVNEEERLWLVIVERPWMYQLDGCWCSAT